MEPIKNEEEEVLEEVLEGEKSEFVDPTEDEELKDEDPQEGLDPEEGGDDEAVGPTPSEEEEEKEFESAPRSEEL